MRVKEDCNLVRARMKLRGLCLGLGLELREGSMPWFRVDLLALAVFGRGSLDRAVFGRAVLGRLKGRSGSAAHKDQFGLGFGSVARAWSNE